MFETKELKKIFSFSKGIVHKEILKKIKKLEDNNDKMDLLKYALRTQLEHNYQELKSKVKTIEEKGHENAFYLLIKTSLLRSKIKLFDATFHKSDYINMIKLFNEIERGVKHV